MKTLHIITWLAHGGAERQLLNLALENPAESAIFSIRSPNAIPVGRGDLGVPVYSGEAKRIASVGWVGKLRRVVQDVQPNVVMGWMYHANLAASITRLLGFSGPILWNVRHSVHDLALEGLSTRLAIRGCAVLARSPCHIVYNSLRAAVQHEALGYPDEKRVVLPNGFDLERFRPDTGARERFRAAIGIPQDNLLLGMIGRVHPMKNHLAWLEAFRKIRAERPNVHCVIVGTGVCDPGGSVVSAVRAMQLEHAITLLPQTSLPEEVYPGLDLLVLPSLWGEGFPNVVGEAMACAVPALVTDVGDAAAVVGDSGFVAIDGSPEQLARSAIEAIQLGTEALSMRGKQARARMESCYGVELVSGLYRELLHSVLK